MNFVLRHDLLLIGRDNNWAHVESDKLKEIKLDTQVRFVSHVSVSNKDECDD